MMTIGIAMHRPIGFKLTQQALAILRSYGSDAHVYLPGSSYTAYGPELGGSTLGVSPWSASPSSGTISGGTWSGMSIYATESLLSTLTVGKQYRCYGSANISGGGAGLYGSGGTFHGNFGASFDFTFTATYAGVVAQANSAGMSLSFSSFSIREVLTLPTASSGLLSNNYTLSDGSTGYSAVDGSAGLVLDAAGSVGAVTTYDFSSSAGWTLAGSDTISGGSLNFVNNTANFATTAYTFTAGKTYKIAFDYTHTSGGGLRQPYDGNVANIVALSASGHYEKLMYCPTSSSTLHIGFGSSAYGVIDNLTIAEVTGIHATQSTTANKPAERRGLYNLLTYSNDLSNGAWSAYGGATKPTATTVSLLATYNSGVTHTVGSLTIGNTVTAAYLLSGTAGAQVYLRIVDEGGAYPQTGEVITLTATPTLYTITRTITQATISVRVDDYGTATSVTVGAIGAFTGTLTAAQILAEGGIPLTTSAAASNPNAGRYWWGTDVSDYLTLSSVPIQFSDDYFLCVGASCDNKAVYPGVIEMSGGVASRAYLYFDASGIVVTQYRDEASASTYVVGPAFSDGDMIVMSHYKQGGLVCTGVNGVDGTPVAAPTGTFTLTSAKLLNGLDGRFAFGVIIKGTVSAADRLVIQRFVALNTPNGPTF